MFSMNSELEQIVHRIKIDYQPEKIILFGSYSEGKAEKGSDVDLLVVKETDKSPWVRAEEVDQNIRHTIPIDILVYTPKEIEERLRINDFFVKEILEKGNVLYERSI